MCVGMFHIFLNIFDIFIYMFDMLIDISICLIIYVVVGPSGLALRTPFRRDPYCGGSRGPQRLPPIVVFLQWQEGGEGDPICTPGGKPVSSPVACPPRKAQVPMFDPVDQL